MYFIKLGRRAVAQQGLYNEPWVAALIRGRYAWAIKASS
jgi:hypothetical protein